MRAASVTLFGPVMRVCLVTIHSRKFFHCVAHPENLVSKYARKTVKNSGRYQLAPCHPFLIIYQMVETFSCPRCHAVYKLVRVKTPPEPGDHPVACLHCGDALAPRENEFLLKYFLVERPRSIPGGEPRSAQAGRD
jgi:hypothetical protein